MQNADTDNINVLIEMFEVLLNRKIEVSQDSYNQLIDLEKHMRILEGWSGKCTIDKISDQITNHFQ